MDLRAIGHRIRSVRTARELTLDEAAQLIGRTGRWLWNVENGRAAANLSDIDGLSRVLRVKPSVLLCLEPVPPASAGEADPVKRRAFAAGLLAVGVSAAVGLPPPGRSPARRIFDGIARDDNTLLATIQTTHATDWEISQYAMRDGAAAAALAGWMRAGATPELRVNAAGILAKMGVSSITEHVVASLRGDDQSRSLYLTAVASRVLRVPWGKAGELVARAEVGRRRSLSWLTDDQAARLALEARDGRDAAGRWCSSVLLGDR